MTSPAPYQGPPDPSTLPAVFKGHAYVKKAEDSLLGKRPQSSSDGRLDSGSQSNSEQHFQSEWKKRKAQNSSQPQPTEDKDPIIPGLQDTTNPLERAYQSKLDFMDDDDEPSRVTSTFFRSLFFIDISS